MRNKVSNNKNRSTDLWRYDAWLGVFMLWPFAAMVRAFAKFRSPHAKKIVWLFFVFFGFVFVIGDPFEGGADSVRYAQRLRELHDNWYGFDYLSTLFYSDDGFVDIYQPLLTWIVAFFTGNARWLFAAFAAVFGYFYVQNMWIIFEKIDHKQKMSLVIALFMLAFALTNPIWNINGVRMWTAAQVFIYGLFRFLLDKEKKGLIWLFSSMFFHFSFFIPIAIFLIYRFLPKNLTGLLIFFYVASLVSELDLGVVRSSLSFLPDFLQPRVTSYTNEAYAEGLAIRRTGLAGHVLLAGIIERWLLYIWVFLVYLKRKYWLNQHESIRNLFIFGLFMGGIAQVLSNVPSGGRFMLLVNVIFFAIFVLFVSERKLNAQLKYYKYITFPFLLFLIIFKIRVGFDYIGIFTFISNPIASLFVEDTIPVIDFVKKIF